MTDARTTEPDHVGLERAYDHDVVIVGGGPAGCAIVSDLVESVDRAEDGGGFVVELQEGDPVTARRVVAGSDEEALFDAIDDDAVREYVAAGPGRPEGSG